MLKLYLQGFKQVQYFFNLSVRFHKKTATEYIISYVALSNLVLPVPKEENLFDIQLS